MFREIPTAESRLSHSIRLFSHPVRPLELSESATTTSAS